MRKFINKDNYIKYLKLDMYLIMVLLVFGGIYITYGFYNDGINIRFINSKVGNFVNKESDLSLILNVEESSNSNNYRVIDKLPINMYSFKSYDCINNSSVEYDNNTNIVKMISSKKDICNVYFDIINSSDFEINIMVQNEYNNLEYSKVSFIPLYGYIFNNYECVNNSTITYDEQNRSLKLIGNNIDKCNVYFNKNENNIDANIYINENGVLELVNVIDNFNDYSINSKSECRLNNIKIDSEIKIVNNNIEIIGENNMKCDVILDKKFP